WPRPPVMVREGRLALLVPRRHEQRGLPLRGAGEGEVAGSSHPAAGKMRPSGSSRRSRIAEPLAPFLALAVAAKDWCASCVGGLVVLLRQVDESSPPPLASRLLS